MATQGMNQSDPLSTKIFNIVVEAMFKQYLSGVCYLEVTYHRIGYGLVDNGEKKAGLVRISLGINHMDTL